jgi:phosphatidylserine/phosphatidylglycerophosphate/cardiolipin synthase-like enzyme
MSLDSTQAAGKAERDLLASWLNDKPGNGIAIGHSEKSAIMHLKMVIIDGVDVVTGSTNWSEGGDTKQDNQMTVIHDDMLKQMAARAAKAQSHPQ